MPISNEVTGDDYIEGEQYNDLRSDALSASVGHSHTGNVDGGRQLDGAKAFAASSIANAKVQIATLSEEHIGNGLLSIKHTAGGDKRDLGADGSTVYLQQSKMLIQAGVYEWTSDSGNKAAGHGEFSWPTPFRTGTRPILMMTPNKTGMWFVDKCVVDRPDLLKYSWSTEEGGSYASWIMHWVAIGLKP